MNYEFIFSIRKHLETEVGALTKVRIIKPGTVLTGTEKPFATIQDVQMSQTREAAGRQSYSDIYRYQLGVYADELDDRLFLQRDVRKALEKPITFYDESLAPTGQSFYCDIDGYTPMSNGDSENETDNHLSYFDISVSINREVGSQEFTQ